MYTGLGWQDLQCDVNLGEQPVCVYVLPVAGL